MKLWEIISNSKFKNKHVLQKIIMHLLGLEDKSQIVSLYDVDLSKLKDKNGNLIESDLFLIKVEDLYFQFEKDKKPLEYILGYVEFFDRKFEVDKNTLIPRPETEYMILSVNGFLSKTNDKYDFVDLGTGCGVLGISILIDNCDKFTQVFLSDISFGALEIAKKNYKNLVKSCNTKVGFLISDLLQEIVCKISNNNLLIVANLPYIPNQIFDNEVEENVKKREPRFAFVGGDDGLDLYRKMFKQIFETNLKTKNVVGFLEMMTWQVEILEKEFSKLVEFKVVNTFHFNIKIVKFTIKK